MKEYVDMCMVAKCTHTCVHDGMFTFVRFQYGVLSCTCNFFNMEFCPALVLLTGQKPATKDCDNVSRRFSRS